jgi:hypothetical protein
VRMGLANSSEEAWNANGGGAFSFKLPKGVSAKVRALETAAPVLGWHHPATGWEVRTGLYDQVHCYLATACRHCPTHPANPHPNKRFHLDSRAKAEARLDLEASAASASPSSSPPVALLETEKPYPTLS